MDRFFSPILTGLRATIGIALIAAVLSALAPVHNAAADQRDSRLPDLFDALKDAPDMRSAWAIEQQIWQLWTLYTGDNDRARMAFTRGLESMNRRDFAMALSWFDIVVADDPGFAEGWNKRATVHYLLGNYKQSLADIDETLKLEPRHFGALAGAGLVNEAMGRPEEALAWWRKAIVVHPNIVGAADRIDSLEDALSGRKI